MKGQISMETLVTLGMALAFTVPVILLLFSFTSVSHEETTIAQADASARTLSDSVNTVYAQGDGAKRSVPLNLPASTEEVFLLPNAGSRAGGEVVVRISTSQGLYDAAAPTIARIRFGAVTDESGLVALEIVNEGGEVSVRESVD